MNMLNKNARNNKMTILRTKTSPGLYIEGVEVKVVVCKTGWVEEGVVLHV